MSEAPRDSTIELRGEPFHYRDWGGQGRPLILLHGLASTSHIFDLVAPRLARNFRVVAPDQRWHGESTKTDEGPGSMDFTGDLLAFIDALEFQRALIAGHSWGAGTALQFAADHPERMEALVLVDGGYTDLQSDPEMTWEKTEKRLAPPRLAAMPVDEFKQHIRHFARRIWSPAVEGIILANFEILPDRTIRPHLTYERHMRILRSMWEQKMTVIYPRIHCPVLLIPAIEEANPEDERIAKWNERKRQGVENAARLLPESKVVWFKDSIHDIPLQRPRRLANEITRFAGKIRPGK